jgi:hypothetical protein
MEPQTFQIIGDTLDLLGTLLIAYAALSVHHRFRHEHKVDDEVFSAMQTEIKLGFVGIGMIIVGFIFQLTGNLLI